MDLELKGKTVLVTGGGAGLGAGICEVFAQEGASVVVNYIVKEEEVFQFVESLKVRFGGEHIAVYGDITKAEDVDAMIQKVEDTFGHLDILVNNAGIWPTTPIAEMTDDEWRKVIDINLNGAFVFSKRACQHFKLKGLRGRVVNVISKSAYAVNTPGHAHYVSSKGGLALMTKAFAREYSEYGIVVNGVIPGMVRTPMNEDKLSIPEVLASYVERIPSGRVSTAQEVGNVVAFLASSKADFINGACVDVTGGMLI